MEDAQLIKNMANRDNRAWSLFIRRFESVIRRRIGQVFYRYSYRAGSAEYQDAFDYILDHFMLDRTLSSFKRSQSLQGFVVRVTTNAVIDWYRTKSSARNLYGVPSRDLVQLVQSDCAVDADVNCDVSSESRELTQLFDGVSWKAAEQAVLRVMSVRTLDIAQLEIQAIAEIARESVSQTAQKLESLRLTLHERWSANKELYDDIGLLWLRSVILDRRGESDRAQQRKTTLDKRLAEYHAKGIEPYPTRKEIAAIFNWDINKVDRIKRTIEDKLREYLDQSAAEKAKMTRIA